MKRFDWECKEMRSRWFRALQKNPMRWRILLMVSIVAEGKKHAKHLR